MRDGGEMEGHVDPDERLYYGPFDLAARPRDVCLYVRGGSVSVLAFYVYKSNVVRIGRSEFDAVLRRASSSTGEETDLGRQWAERP